MQRVDPYGLVGQVLDGQFRVDAPIGEGGCSVVYRGHHIGLDAPVAIKCLKLQQQLGTAFVQAFEQRFRDESKIQYRLSQGSLHIVRTLAAGTTIAPATSALVPYMVLEWLDGYTLAEQLRARRERGERGRPLADVVRMLDPVAEAMAFAHGQGVVHRDLNPSNLFVMVQPDGTQRLKVMDFGVAKVVSDHALDIGKRAATLGPIRMFTPAYGAPEQFSSSFGAVSPATDVFAFALLLVELLIDRSPVEGEHLSEFMAQATDPNVRPTPWTLGCTTVGETVEGLMTKALSVDPTKRPPDIGAFWGALKNALHNDEEIAKRRSSQPPPALVPLSKPTTKKGTLILRPESSPFLESPSSSSIFADSTTNSKGGTLALGAHPGPAAAPGSITVRPPSGQTTDTRGPTHAGDARPGASPLSMTVQPGQQLISPEQQALIDQHWQNQSPSSAPPASKPRLMETHSVVPPAPPPSALPPTARAGLVTPAPTPAPMPPQQLPPGASLNDSTLASATNRPLAPEPSPTPPSSSRRAVAVALIAGGFILALCLALLLSHFLVR